MGDITQGAEAARRFANQARGRVSCRICSKLHHRSGMGWKFCLRKVVNAIFKRLREREMFVHADQDVVRVTLLLVDGAKLPLDEHFVELAGPQEDLEDRLERKIYTWKIQTIRGR